MLALFYPLLCTSLCLTHLALALYQKLFWRWTHSRAVVITTDFPLQWRSPQLEHHLPSRLLPVRNIEKRMRLYRVTSELSSQPTWGGLLWLQANALEETWRLAVGELKRVLDEREKLSKSILASIYYALGSGLYSPTWLLVMKSRGSFIDSAVYYISPLSLYR